MAIMQQATARPFPSCISPNYWGMRLTAPRLGQVRVWLNPNRVATPSPSNLLQREAVNRGEQRQWITRESNQAWIHTHLHGHAAQAGGVCLAVRSHGVCGAAAVVFLRRRAALIVAQPWQHAPAVLLQQVWGGAAHAATIHRA
eukprot:215721-Pelagomonas_calceolata.AAC.1